MRVSRMGDELNPRICNGKVVLAVNEPLDELVASRKFRADLRHRVRQAASFPSLGEIVDERGGDRLKTSTGFSDVDE